MNKTTDTAKPDRRVKDLRPAFIHSTHSADKSPLGFHAVIPARVLILLLHAILSTTRVKIASPGSKVEWRPIEAAE